MREYLTMFSLVGLTFGIVMFTVIFLRDVGMTYETYRAWISVLLSFTSLISNAAMSYYFVKKVRRVSQDRSR
jgi:hypothetical protein